MRGQFAALPLRRDGYLAGSSNNMLDICLNTHFRSIYIDMNIVKINEGKDFKGEN